MTEGERQKREGRKRVERVERESHWKRTGWISSPSGGKVERDGEKVLGEQWVSRMVRGAKMHSQESEMTRMAIPLRRRGRRGRE